MRTLKIAFLCFFVFTISSLFISCSDDDDDSQENLPQLASLENPYFISPVANPGGIGFDFYYNQQPGGANNIDDPTVEDFIMDLKVKTIRAEKPDGTLAGTPFIQLFNGTRAVNYSTIDPDCKGFDEFQNLNASNIQNYSLESDGASFDISSVPIGNSGQPLMQNLMQELNKLVIGTTWREFASSETIGDEPVWIVSTNDGKIVKFIVTEAPPITSNGYVTIEWGFIE